MQDLEEGNYIILNYYFLLLQYHITIVTFNHSRNYVDSLTSPRAAASAKDRIPDWIAH